MKMDSRLVLALDETDGKKALAVAESVGDIVDAEGKSMVIGRDRCPKSQ